MRASENVEGKQLVMDKPIKLEIFTDYV